MKSKENGALLNQSFESNLAEKFMGQPVAVLCMRYWYRGRLTEVGTNYITLSDVHAVEQTGSATREQPDQEDAVPSDVTIKTDVIEIVCQPAWVWHGFSEDKKKKAKKA